MARTAKIAVSIETELLKRLEVVRAQTGETRSAAVSRALRLLTRDEERTRRVAEYVRAYQETPEAPAEVEAARQLARRGLKGLAWDPE